MSEKSSTVDDPAPDEMGSQWKSVKLGEVARKRTENVDPQEVDLDRHVGLEHIESNNPLPDWEPIDNLSSTKRRFEPGDILFAKLRPNLEKSAQPDFKGIASTDIFPIVAEQGINSKYLLYRLSSKAAFDHARRTSVGTRMPRTSWNLFGNFEFGLPPLDEQRKIASVLYTVDQAIQKTEEIISKTERVETGLLQTLFSGEHLDCEKQEHSTLGEIPTHWDVKQMGNACSITMGSSPKSEYYNEDGDGLPFFQANNEFGLRNPTHDRWCSEPVKTATEDDVLMTIRGTYVGQVNVADRYCCIGRGLAGISAEEEHLPEFLYHHLRRRERYVKSIAIGSTFDSVSSSELENLDIVVPPIEEQREIADTLRTAQHQRLDAHKYHDQLQKVKRGLMQDLLSGKKRTSNTDIEALDEIQRYE